MSQTQKPVLILGATSSLAKALATEFASRGYPLILSAREEHELSRCASDLHLRYGVNVQTVPLDILRFDQHEEVLERCWQAAQGPLEGAVLAIGYLVDQRVAEKDDSETRRILDTNFVAPVSLLNRLGLYFERQHSGFICVISSVAGERGRASNYVYGASKGGLSLYLQGLRSRLFHSQVAVINVKLGVVDTQMTYGLPRLFLKTSPEKAAKHIYRGIQKRRGIFFSPSFWRGIMWVVRNIPETFFKRQKW
jgi:short-subunit dehydrogenase